MLNIIINMCSKWQLMLTNQKLKKRLKVFCGVQIVHSGGEARHGGNQKTMNMTHQQHPSKYPPTASHGDSLERAKPLLTACDRPG